MAPARTGTRAAKVYDELGVPELILVPAVLLSIAGVALFLFGNILRMMSDFGKASFAKQGAIQAQVQPIFAAARPAMAAIFGGVAGAGGLKVDLSTLLLTAVLLVLVGIWRGQYIANQLLRKQLAEDKDE